MSEFVHNLDAFLAGGCTVMFVCAGTFFLRYWLDTKDRLFLSFAVSFWLQACTRLLIYFFAADESRAHFYWLRLVAFLIIIWAIVDKNRSRKAAEQT
jgi:hypothetical protein